MVVLFFTTNSKLSYPKIFVGNERKVYLSGEGFFEISKDP
jgi:hypothetical protein